MPTSFGRESAKIYSFPLGGRRPAVGSRQAKPVPPQPPVISDTFGSGWYHEAAIRDDERTRKP
jgi:hypothetical protein